LEREEQGQSEGIEDLETGFSSRYPVRDRRPTQGGRSDGAGGYRGYVFHTGSSKRIDLGRIKLRATGLKAPKVLKPKVAWD
jgi:hypothetical protein